MTFEEWWEGVATNDAWVRAICKEAWEAAFDEGVKWALQQDANTLNKLGLTKEQECRELLAKLNPKEYGDDEH